MKLNPYMLAQLCNSIFDKAILDYHINDNVNAACINTYKADSLEFLLYQKNWVDTVQWHLEDIVRNPDIAPVEGLSLKRKIDKSNQVRTDMVEFIDSFFLEKYKEVAAQPDATINTESPAWAIDRLSILALKIFHMNIEAERAEAKPAHRAACLEKLNVLLEQRKDLSEAINTLMEDIASGKKYMKAYKQMKMYNDPSLNPVLYQQHSK
jgi:hypothetical protein